MRGEQMFVNALKVDPLMNFLLHDRMKTSKKVDKIGVDLLLPLRTERWAPEKDASCHFPLKV